MSPSLPGHQLPVFFSGRNPGLSALDARLLARGRVRSTEQARIELPAANGDVRRETRLVSAANVVSGLDVWRLAVE